MREVRGETCDRRYLGTVSPLAVNPVGDSYQVTR